MIPLRLTLYGPDQAIRREYVRNGVIWGVFKRATRIAKALEQAGESLTGLETEALSGLVCEAFGEQFTADELAGGSTVVEQMAVLTAILALARELMRTSQTPPDPGSGQAPGAADDWMVDLEISLVNAFRWSLCEIDATDLETLLRFVARMTAASIPVEKTVYCDEVPGF